MFMNMSENLYIYSQKYHMSSFYSWYRWYAINMRQFNSK